LVILFGTVYALETVQITNFLEVVKMKKVISTIVAAIVALSFSAVVFAADATAPAADTTAPAAEVKKPAKKAKKAKKAVKKDAAPSQSGTNVPSVPSPPRANPDAPVQQ
jgi:nitrate reductase cytochrome c-type subunit